MVRKYSTIWIAKCNTSNYLLSKAPDLHNVKQHSSALDESILTNTHYLNIII